MEYINNYKLSKAKNDALELLAQLGSLSKNNYDEGQPIRIITKEEKKQEIFNEVIEKSKQKRIRQRAKKDYTDIISKIKELINKGLVAEEIAKELNYTVGTVYFLCREYKITLNKKVAIIDNQVIIDKIQELLLQGKTYQEINKLLDISVGTVRECVKKYNLQHKEQTGKEPKLNETHIELFNDLFYNKALSLRKIAREFGVGDNTIYRFIKKYNIKVEEEKINRQAKKEIQKEISRKIKEAHLKKRIEEKKELKNKIEKLLQQGKSRAEISRILEINKDCLYNICKSLNIEAENQRNKFKLEGKDELIKELFYKKGMNCAQIMKYLNCGHACFYRYVKHKNIILKR